MKPKIENSRALRYLLAGLITALGAFGGYLYYSRIGCVDGTCPITGNPVISTLYGGIIGLLLAGIFVPGKKKPELPPEE